MDKIQNKQLEKIWLGLNRQIRAFIRSKVDDEQKAEDILQEVYLKLHQGLASLKHPEKIKNWLFQITRNVIIDHYRSTKNYLPIVENTAFFEDNFDINPLDKIQTSLLEMINQMPDIYRDALILTEYEGLSQKVVAKKLGISYSGVKSRVQRARTLLKEMLFKCCHFELDKYGNIIDYYQVSCSACLIKK